MPGSTIKVTDPATWTILDLHHFATLLFTRHRLLNRGDSTFVFLLPVGIHCTLHNALSIAYYEAAPTLQS